MLNLMFWRLVAWAVGQWIPVAAVPGAMAVVSMTKLRTWRKKTFVAPQFKLLV